MSNMTPDQFALLAKLTGEGIDKLLLPGGTNELWEAIKDEISNRPEFDGISGSLYDAICQLSDIYTTFKSRKEQISLDGETGIY